MAAGAAPGFTPGPAMILGESDAWSLPLNAFVLPPQYAQYLDYVLIPNGMIKDRVEKMAADVLACYPSSTPHLLVVLNVRAFSSRGPDRPGFCMRSPLVLACLCVLVRAGRERVWERPHACHEGAV